MFSLDTETTGKDFYHGAQPFFVTTCDEADNITFWEWDVDPITRKVIPVTNEYSLEEDLEQIASLIWNTDTEIVMQAGKFDVTALQTMYSPFKWPWDRTHDTLTMGHTLASNQRKDLGSLAILYLERGIEGYEKDLERAVREARKIVRKKFPEWRLAEHGLEEMPSCPKTRTDKSGQGDEKDAAWKFDYWLPRALAKALNYRKDHYFWTVLSIYSNVDSGITLPLFKSMRYELEQRGHWKLYDEKRKLNKISYDLSRRGVTYSISRTKQQIEKYSAACAEADKNCIALSGTKVDASSGLYADRVPLLSRTPQGVTKELQQIIWDEFELVPQNYSKKTGRPSLDKGSIEEWLKMLDPDDHRHMFLKNLSNFRQSGTALTYLKGYERYALPSDHKDFLLLHPSANSDGTDTLRWAFSNPNEANICFDGETEFLTEDGWTRADSIEKGKAIAQFWPGGQIDFVVPELVKQHFKGDMKHIRTTDQIDMLLTPSHRCLIQDRKGKYKVCRASNFPQDHKHFHAGRYVGGTLALSRAEIVWLCAVQADGHYSVVDEKEYGIQFSFQKERKIKRLRKCLLDLGASFSERVEKGSGATSFYIGINDPAVLLAKRLMPEKTLGRWVLELDRLSLDLFCQEVLLWDGSTTLTDAARYSSSERVNSDWVQIAFALSESRVNLHSKMPESSWAKREHHYLGITRGQSYSYTSNRTVNDVAWDGPVYCAVVPSSFIVIRRNGRVSITGNSKREGFNLRYCFGPTPDREWYSGDAQNLELRIPAFEADEKDLVWVFTHPEEPPYFGSYHLVVFDLLHPELFREHGVEVKTLFESTWYQWTKNGNFSVIYGAQKRKADLTYHIDGAFEKISYRFPRIAALREKQMAYAKKWGYVETMPDKEVCSEHGYPLLCSRTPEGYIMPTTVLNYHVSGTAMWWMARAMIKCEAQLDEWRDESIIDAWIAMQVHDELVFSFPRGRGSKPWLMNLPKIRRLKQLMESCGDAIGVPTPVSFEYHTEGWDVGLKLAV